MWVWMLVRVQVRVWMDAYQYRTGSPDWLSSSRLVSPSSSSSNFSLPFPVDSRFQQTQSPPRPKDPESAGTAKDCPHWVPVAVSSSVVVGFIGLLVTLLPPNPLFLLRPSPPGYPRPCW